MKNKGKAIITNKVIYVDGDGRFGLEPNIARLGIPKGTIIMVYDEIRPEKGNIPSKVHNFVTVRSGISHTTRNLYILNCWEYKTYDEGYSDIVDYDTLDLEWRKKFENKVKVERLKWNIREYGVVAGDALIDSYETHRFGLVLKGFHKKKHVRVPDFLITHEELENAIGNAEFFNYDTNEPITGDPFE